MSEIGDSAVSIVLVSLLPNAWARIDHGVTSFVSSVVLGHNYSTERLLPALVKMSFMMSPTGDGARISSGAWYTGPSEAA